MRGRHLGIVGLLVLLAAPAASPGGQAVDGTDGSVAGDATASMARRRPGGRDAPGVLASFRDAVSRAALSTVVVRGDGRRRALATVVSADGLLVTKASELGGRLFCELGGVAPDLEPDSGETAGRRLVRARVLASDVAFDLALLKIEASGLHPVDWATKERLAPGRVVLSVGPQDRPLAMGIVGVAPRAMSGGRGFLGVQLEQVELGARVSEVLEATPAKRIGIERGDRIIAIDGRPVADVAAVIERIGSHAAGETISVTLERGAERLALDAVLAPRPAPDRSGGRDARFEGERSSQRNGFPSVLQHDGVVRPEACGGPLVTIDGSVVGLNIARAGRTTTYAIPADEMVRLVEALRRRARETSGD